MTDRRRTQSDDGK